ncbi:MAG: hypothetical protein QM749_15075 [Aquabacterium sp.]
MSQCRLQALASAILLLAVVGGARACTAVPLPLASVNDRLNVPLEGEISQAWACKDTVGEHIVLATRQMAPEPVQGTQIQFSKFTKSASGWKRDWQARDFLLDSGSRISTSEIILLKDVDGDGLAEVFIAYSLPGRTGEPDTGKLLVYYKDHKYAIRGAIARTANDFGSRKMDAGFQALPAQIQAQALQLWDKLSPPAGLNKAPLLQASDPPAAGRRASR